MSGLLVAALEASADLHAAAVLRELRKIRPEVRAFGAGGPRLRAEGLEALVRAEDCSVMGIAEVLPALPRLLEAMDALEEAARQRAPAAALLVDSPDFNLRLARRLRRQKVKVAYFIGPSVWAWRTYRVRQIARDVARMLVILPFEAAFYARHGVAATYVGNPLVDDVAAAPSRQEARERIFGTREVKVLALLPGSRLQEVHRLWPRMLAAGRELQARHAGLRLLVPVAPTIDRALLGYAPGVDFVADAPLALLAADAAIVASGTATLEAAIAGTPLVTVYRTSALSFLVGRLLVRVPHISLPNLLAGRAVVPELLQSDCTAARMAAEAAKLLEPGPERMAQIEALRAVREQLLPKGAKAAARAAAEQIAALLDGR